MANSQNLMVKNGFWGTLSCGFGGFWSWGNLVGGLRFNRQ
jgi:hypothetical protein